MNADLIGQLILLGARAGIEAWESRKGASDKTVAAVDVAVQTAGDVLHEIGQRTSLSNATDDELIAIVREKIESVENLVAEGEESVGGGTAGGAAPGG